MKIMVNEDRTVLVTVYDDGTTTVATRPHESGIWGPPSVVLEER